MRFCVVLVISCCHATHYSVLVLVHLREMDIVQGFDYTQEITLASYDIMPRVEMSHFFKRSAVFFSFALRSNSILPTKTRAGRQKKVLFEFTTCHYPE